jgi:hypothetical protein
VSILTLTEYRTKASNPYSTIQVTKASLAVATDRLNSLWTATPFNGAAPGAAAVPTPSTAGAIPEWRAPTGTARLARTQVDHINSLATRGTLFLCDRLSHQSGLSGTSLVAQTTNLPTAALTRYTDGIGVSAAFEIYTLIGTSAPVVTASYTNQAGTSGQTSIGTLLGGTNQREVGRFIPMPLASGDTGVRSVESVTLASSTGTVGNFGITLYKMLAAFPLELFSTSRDQFLAGNLIDVHDDACLFWLFMPSGASAIGNFQATVSFIEDDV